MYKLPGTLAHFTVLGLVHPHTIKLFLPSDVTHVRKNTRPSTAFLYWKQRKAVQGLGTSLACSCLASKLHMLSLWLLLWVLKGLHSHLLAS